MNAQIVKALQTAGIAPEIDSDTEPLDGIDESGRLMPWLQAAWEQAGSDRDADDWIRTPENELYLVDPTHGPRAVFDLLGTRLLWLPKQAKPRFLGIVSSRLGRDLHSKSAWFRSLRAACVQGTQRRETLITSPGTTTHRFARRCHELFGIDVLEFDVNDATSLSDWFREAVCAAAENSRNSKVGISPQFAGETSVAFADVPAADRAVAALADRLIALSVRASGNWDRLIHWRLESDYFQAGRTLIALGKNLVVNRLRDELLQCGAVGWTIWPGSSTEPLEIASKSSAGSLGNESDSDKSTMTRVSREQTKPREGCKRDAHDSWKLIRDGVFLTHCTRRRDGPWPDQDETSYLDDLILNREQANHSALAALRRIITMRRLMASQESIRGNTPVVSLTEVPLAELHQLRVFRPHRGRWDFEPYGICICREWIRRSGGRPVRYAARARWDSLPESERLFYQLDVTVTKTGNELDWTVEQEWRVIGDLALASLSPHDAFVFVPTEEEATEIRKVSPWPVVALSTCQPADLLRD